MNFEEVRTKSLTVAKKLGYELPSGLPLLDSTIRLQPSREIENRALVLAGVVASSYGFPRDRVISWLDQEGLWSSVSLAEEDFLRHGKGSAQQFQMQVESLYAFAWALGYLPSLDFDKPSPANLVAVFPDFKVAESSAKFRDRANPRSQDEVAFSCDLAYCLHWAVSQAALDGKAIPGKVPQHVVIERRRALEWMLSADEWEEVSLDT